MKPKIIHKEAMDYSFQAKKAKNEGDHDLAFQLYQSAAKLESQVADFYFDRPDLEPTRSIIIRSAAFLNLKAGRIEQAKKYIFFGLLHSTNEQIREQLNNALEIAVSLGNHPSEMARSEYDYLLLLRQRSIHYVIEPSNLVSGNSATLKMVKDFSEGYLKSLKAFAMSQLRRIQGFTKELEESIAKDAENLVNPLITNSSYGSFKFSIANDFLNRMGEKEEISKMKRNILPRFHEEIFVNQLSDEDISEIKQEFSEEEVNDIFRPLIKLKSLKSPYRIGYYDSETYNKKYLKRIVNKQRKQLISTKQISQEDIGELQNMIIHKRSTQSGKISKKTIFQEQLKTGEFDVKTRLIEPDGSSPIILMEDILLNVAFDSGTGFTVSFDDLNIESTDIEYDKAIKGFNSTFYNKMVDLANKKQRTDQEESEWNSISKLIGNPDTLKQ